MCNETNDSVTGVGQTESRLSTNKLEERLPNKT